jgi:hypothetical protein
MAFPRLNAVLRAKIMQDGSFPMFETFCAGIMRGFAFLHTVLYDHHKRTRWQFVQLVSLLLAFPCFKISHLFFKFAYSLQQRRLRLLCGEDFFLKFYDRRVAAGGIVNVLQSLREIKSGLDGAQASNHFSDHRVSSLKQSLEAPRRAVGSDVPGLEANR